MKKIFEGGSSGRNQQNDVPWHNSINKDKSEVGNEYLCKRIIVCANGLLLLSDKFKAFLFDGMQINEHIRQALLHYVKSPENSVPIIMEVSTSKIPDLGILEDYEGSGVWREDEKGYFFAGDTALQDSKPQSNPFLPPTQESTKKRSGGTRRSKEVS